MTAVPGRMLIGVNLKMYFGHARALRWASEVRSQLDAHPALSTGIASMFVLPSFPAIPEFRAILGEDADVGSQDVALEDSGAFTGEVSAGELAELGCRYALVGHRERRRRGDSPAIVRGKLVAASRNGLTPILCVGEEFRVPATVAAADCLEQLEDAIGPSPWTSEGLVVAYEPAWAIGSPAPAPRGHIVAVATALRERLDERGVSSSVLYGGTAGPGMLAELGSRVDGLFLGRRAHDPSAIAAVLDEVVLLGGEGGRSL